MKNQKDRNFTTPVSMKVTQEQYERDLKKPLEELGYKLCMDEFLATFEVLNNHYAGTGAFEINVFDAPTAGSYLIRNYNPELFLALAAMTEGSVCIKGEYHISRDKALPPPECEMNKKEYDGKKLYFLQKATKEELIKHFSKDVSCCIEDHNIWNNYHKLDTFKMKTKERFPIIIGLKELRQLRRAVNTCVVWIARIDNELAAQLSTSDEIKVSKDFYEGARNDANEEQHKVLDEVFGKYELSVEEELLNMCQGFTPEVSGTYRVEKLLETFDIKFKE